MEHLEAYHKLSEGQDWTLHFTFDDLAPARFHIEKIRQENVEEFLKGKYLEESAYSMFVDSCVHLQRLYRIIANRYAKDVNEKIEYLKKVFEVCKKSHIGSLEGQASLLLGNLYEEIGDYRTALSYFENYYEISRRDNDLVNFGRASESLAKCHEKLGQINKSIEILEKYLKEAMSNKEINEQYSRACDCLTVIYNSLGKYETASEYAKKSFDVSRQMQELKHLEYNRVLFGISNAHKNLKLFENNIESGRRKNINNLIWWKYDSRREKLLRDYIVNSNDDYDQDDDDQQEYENNSDNNNGNEYTA